MIHTHAHTHRIAVIIRRIVYEPWICNIHPCSDAHSNGELSPSRSPRRCLAVVNAPSRHTNENIKRFPIAIPSSCVCVCACTLVCSAFGVHHVLDPNRLFHPRIHIPSRWLCKLLFWNNFFGVYFVFVGMLDGRVSALRYSDVCVSVFFYILFIWNWRFSSWPRRHLNWIASEQCAHCTHTPSRIILFVFWYVKYGWVLCCVRYWARSHRRSSDRIDENRLDCGAKMHR